jgi:hypothetical protein
LQEALVDVWTKRRQIDDLARWVTTAAILAGPASTLGGLDHGRAG